MSGATRPYVVAHVGVSLDGATTGFDVDVGAFYRLAGAWSEDLTLVGADTVLAQEAALVQEPGPGPAVDGPLLAVVDGRARVQGMDATAARGRRRQVSRWPGLSQRAGAPRDLRSCNTAGCAQEGHAHAAGRNLCRTG